MLYFPIGSMHWNIREQPRPQARLMASARNGRVIVASALVETDGELWLGLAEGGWVRLRHHQFMADHFGTRHEYGWFPEQEMSSAQARANQRTDAVPVPLDMVMGSAAGLGFAMMLPNDPSSVALMRTAYGP